jgi:hypothetical protein
VEEQSSGELASADPTTRAKDAGLQEPGINPTIPLNPCSRIQHLQRPTSSDISVDAPPLSRRGDGHLAGGGCLRVLTARSLLAFLVRQRDKAIGGARPDPVQSRSVSRFGVDRTAGLEVAVTDRPRRAAPAGRDRRAPAQVSRLLAA